jgi:hypothetical protein
MRVFFIVLTLVTLFGQVLFGQVLLPSPERTYNSKFPYKAVECSMNSYPETISIGDTLYATLEVNNPHEEIILFNDSYLGDGRFLGTVRLDIIDSSQRSFSLLCEVPMRKVLDWGPDLVKLEPKETRIVGRYSVTIPPLEDLFSNPYWQKMLNDLPKKGESFKLKITLALYSHDLRRAKEENKIFLEKKFLLQQRTSKDIELFRQWYDNTPKNLLPEIDTEIAPLPVKIGGAYMRELTDKLHLDFCKMVFRPINRRVKCVSKYCFFSVLL